MSALVIIAIIGIVWAALLVFAAALGRAADQADEELHERLRAARAAEQLGVARAHDLSGVWLDGVWLERLDGVWLERFRFTDATESAHNAQNVVELAFERERRRRGHS